MVSRGTGLHRPPNTGKRSTSYITIEMSSHLFNVLLICRIADENGKDDSQSILGMFI